MRHGIPEDDREILRFCGSCDIHSLSVVLGRGTVSAQQNNIIVIKHLYALIVNS